MVFILFQESFLDDIIQRVMTRLTKAKPVMNRLDVVVLFKQLSLVNFIFDNNPRLSKYLTDNFYEEFRYVLYFNCLI